MKEPHRKGPASHPDPESCDGPRKGPGEALTGENTGREIELRNQHSGVPTTLHEAEGNTEEGAKGKPTKDPTESKDPNMCGNSSHGNREIPAVPKTDEVAGRSEKATNHKSDTHAAGKSHGCIVPKKLPNKCGSRGLYAEAGEGRPPTKRNVQQTATIGTQSPANVSTGLERVREAARRDKDERFTALLHHITVNLLRESYDGLKRRAAPGVDGMTWEQYGHGLEQSLRELHERIHRGTYRAQPSKRTYIPKADGKMRPLGIAALEDKIVQQAVVTILNAIYEEDFLGFSYGFRPGHSAHDALDALWVGLTEKKVNWVLDADIRGFFDNISHEWMQKFIEHRIADPRILRLIKKWLRAGISEDGEWSETKVGTPQGAVISPLLANIFLHYVFDLWAHKWRKQKAKGDVINVRYADDFVMGFQNRSEAEQFLNELKERLEKFGLTLHPDKTRLIEFGRFAIETRKRRGEGKPETFNFLGFTHICAKTLTNRKFTVLRKTIAKRMAAKLKWIRDKLWKRRHEPAIELSRWLGSVVRGYLNYHAIPGNAYRIREFRDETVRHLLRALRRRSQKHRLTWKRYGPFVNRWVPSARIVHPYPNARFHAKYAR